MRRLLRLCVALTLAVPAAGNAQGHAQAARLDEVTVSPTGAVRTITAALARVRSGGRIIVNAGTYREPTLEITQPVELVGVDTPVLAGDGTHGILLVKADDVTVRGFS